MKKYIGLLVLMCTPLFLTLGCDLQKSEKPQEEILDFAVVDRTKIFVDSTLGKTGFERIQQLQSKAEESLYALEAKINALEESVEEKTLRMQVELQGGLQNLQALLDADQHAVVELIEKTLDETITEVRTAKKIPLVFASETVLSYDAKNDITQDVIDALNAKNTVFPPLPDVTLPDPAVREKPTETKEEKSADKKEEVKKK